MATTSDLFYPDVICPEESRLDQNGWTYPFSIRNRPVCPIGEACTTAQMALQMQVIFQEAVTGILTDKLLYWHFHFVCIEKQTHKSLSVETNIFPQTFWKNVNTGRSYSASNMKAIGLKAYGDQQGPTVDNSFGASGQPDHSNSMI